MLLLAFLLIPATLAAERETTINNHIVKINGDTLISVNPTPTSSSVLNLSDLGLRIIADNAFENLTTLENLDLGKNSLASIPKQLFSNLENLEHLSLANNNLTSFEKVFEGLNHLKTLNISNNPLSRLEATALSGLPRSSVVFTKGLSLEIISAFVFEKKPGTLVMIDEIFKMFLNTDQNSTQQAQEQDDSAKMEARRRRNADNNRLIKICIDGDILKRVELLEENETLISGCRLGELSDPHTLNLTNLGIAQFEKNWYRLNTTTPIVRIRFTGNNIVHVMPELVNDLPSSVSSIDLERNKIERLENGTLEHTRISSMNLKSNAIREIEDGAFTKMPHLIELYLTDNLLNNTRFMSTLPGSIRILLLQKNKITEISPRSFSSLRNLIFFHLNGNLIQEMKSDSFQGLRFLMDLELSDNQISKIEPKSFQQLKYLYRITLNNNNIVNFENGTFDNLRGLGILDVSYNKLSGIKRSFPNGLPPYVKILNLGFNEIEKLGSDDFKNVSFSYLTLSGNKISEIEPGALELPTLRELILDNNKLARLDTDSFRGLNNLDALNLAYNRITIIPKNFTANMDRLEELNLSYNPIHKLQNGALYGFRKTAYSKVILREVPVEIIEGGLFDDM